MIILLQICIWCVANSALSFGKMTELPCGTVATKKVLRSALNDIHWAFWKLYGAQAAICIHAAHQANNGLKHLAYALWEQNIIYSSPFIVIF